MPLALDFIATLFLLLTALQSAKKPYLFKTSLLAVLFHGLDGINAGDFRDKEDGLKREMTRHTRRDLVERAGQCKVRLGRNKDGELKMIKVD